jgi:hypothetical protein
MSRGMPNKSSGMPSKKIDPQFIFGLLIIAIWAFYLYKPFSLVDSSTINDPNCKEKLTLITDMATKISALFSTALGFVLGHFFGKQGVENAQKQASQAIEEKIQSQKNSEEAIGVAGAAEDRIGALDQKVNNLGKELANVTQFSKEAMDEVKDTFKIINQLIEAIKPKKNE